MYDVKQSYIPHTLDCGVHKIDLMYPGNIYKGSADFSGKNTWYLENLSRMTRFMKYFYKNRTF